MIRRLAPILGITFIDILGFSMLIPLLPYFATHFHATPFIVGVIFATFSFCQLVSGPIWGNVSDRIGRKGVLIISQIGATIGWAMLGAATTIPMIFLARIVEGASGGNIGVTQAYVADLVEPKERSRAFGLIMATFSAGMIFGPLIESVLYSRFGYSAPFYAAAALQFVTLLATIRFLPESRSKGEEVVGAAEIVRTFKNPKFSPLLWQKLALSLAMYAWFGVMALYLAQQLHFGLIQTDYFFTAIASLNVVVNVFLISRVSDRLGDRGMSTVGLLALVAAFGLVSFVNSVYELAAMAALLSVGMALSNSGLTALISNAADARRQGTVLGVTSSLDSFSGIVSPPISTAALGGLGSHWAGAASCFFATIAFIAGVLQSRRGDARIPAATPQKEGAS
ncbi:MAG TPA: MFS transporter [Candidatus Rubrimentiphilum sp.]|nr:MFS transporter [Candidatus Rubrimentiphilum sp.]